MTARRSTADMVRDHAERELIIRDRVAYARQVAIDPEFKSTDAQLLPDRFYAHAQRKVTRGVWTQDVATAWLQGKAHARRMKAIGVGQRRAARHRVGLSRIDAALHNVLKTGGASALVLLVLYLVTGPTNAAVGIPLALTVTAIRAVGGLVTREVL